MTGLISKKNISLKKAKESLKKPKFLVLFFIILIIFLCCSCSSFLWAADYFLPPTLSMSSGAPPKWESKQPVSNIQLLCSSLDEISLNNKELTDTEKRSLCGSEGLDVELVDGTNTFAFKTVDSRERVVTLDVEIGFDEEKYIERIAYEKEQKKLEEEQRELEKEQEEKDASEAKKLEKERLAEEARKLEEEDAKRAAEQTAREAEAKKQAEIQARQDQIDLWRQKGEAISGISPQEIKEEYESQKNLSQAKGELYLERLQGEPVVYAGQVFNVRTETFGDGYYISMDVEGESVFIEDPAGKYIDINKGAVIKVTGRIEHVSSFLGINVYIQGASVEVIEN